MIGTRWVCVVCLFALFGCDGAIGDPPSSRPPDQEVRPPDREDVRALCEQAGSELRVGRTPLRRLTRAQLNNTVAELLDVGGQPFDAISPDERVGPFYSNAIAPITDLIVRQHMEVAAGVVDGGPTLAELLPCDPVSAGEDACADQFITEFGLRAFRRPMTADEITDYRGLYDFGRTVDFDNGITLVFDAMLQSPNFLYHAEVGEAGAPSLTPSKLSSYELASRLSYFLWNSMPDDELFAAAEGDLHDPAVLDGQVQRMLDDPRAKEAMASFHLQWLGIGDMAEVEKDPTLFPAYSSEMRAAMRAETANFADYVIRRGDGNLRTLLSAPFSLLDGPLFDLYGVERPADHDPNEPVDLDPTQRAGIITQAAFLASHAHHNQTSPVHRGIVIRENFLCHPIPSPPPAVDNTPPAVTEVTTTRERFAAHEADPVCAGCHRLVDRIGLGLENYDPVGAWRTEDGPSEVDPRGEIVDADPGIEGEFEGAIELADRLSSSDQVSDCVARQWFRYSLGRIESNDDACSLDDIFTGFSADYDIRELLLRIVTSEAFRHVRLVGTEGEVAP